MSQDARLMACQVQQQYVALTRAFNEAVLNKLLTVRGESGKEQ